jgi:hypothetical protein
MALAVVTARARELFTRLVRLSLVGLRPRRARLRFTGQGQYSKKSRVEIGASRGRSGYRWNCHNHLPGGFTGCN